jgi:hypothetical protein
LYEKHPMVDGSREQTSLPFRNKSQVSHIEMAGDQIIRHS